MERKVKELPDCLLVSKLSFPQEDILACGRCPARSDDIGDLGPKCVNTPRS